MQKVKLNKKMERATRIVSLKLGNGNYQISKALNNLRFLVINKYYFFKLRIKNYSNKWMPRHSCIYIIFNGKFQKHAMMYVREKKL